MKILFLNNTLISSIVSMFTASVLLQAFAGCSSSYPAPGVEGRKYQYIYQIIEPASSTKLEYKDASMSISFDIDDAAISYTILNLTQQQLTIESGAAMIGIDNKFVPARNVNSFYSDSIKGFAPLIVPSRGYVEDMVIPRTSVYWTEKGWVEKDLFPTLDSGTVSGRKSVVQNVGKKIDLLLPIIIGQKKTEYRFSFKVSAIKVLSPNSPIAAKQRPPAPSLYNGTVDPWFAVYLSGGIAFIAGVVILSAKKPVGPLN